MANIERYFPVVKKSSSLKQKNVKKSASRYTPYEASAPRDVKRSVASRSSPTEQPNYVYCPIPSQAIGCRAQRIFVVDFER